MAPTILGPPKEAGLLDLLTNAGARLSCYFTGRFPFRFSNASGRSVKLHIVEDKPGVKQDYFLSVPKGFQDVEVPLACGSIVVTAGFYRPEDEDYEIFWEKRPFVWEKDIQICVHARHSVISNRVRTDVFFGAPLSSSGFKPGLRGPGSCSTRAPSVGGYSSSGEGGSGGGGSHGSGHGTLNMLRGAGVASVAIYSQGEGRGAWRGGDVDVEAASGPLKDYEALAAREPLLLALPPGVAADELAGGGAQGPPSEDARAKARGVPEEPSLMRPVPRHRQHPADARLAKGLSIGLSLGGPRLGAAVSMGPFIDRSSGPVPVPRCGRSDPDDEFD